MAANPGYTYLPAFDIENFLKTNVPNTSNRCYANSTTQLLRMIPELYDALPPYDNQQPVGPLEFVRFMHRNLKITDPNAFAKSYRTMIEATLRICSLDPGQQDQSEFFSTLIRTGDEYVKRAAIPASKEAIYSELKSRQTVLELSLTDDPANPLLKFNKDLVNQNIEDIDKSRTNPGNKVIHSSLWNALTPHLMFKSSTKFTLTAGPDCSETFEKPTEYDDEDEPLVQLRASEFPDRTPIQHFFNARREIRNAPISIIQSMVHKPACADLVTKYIQLNEQRKANDAALVTVREINVDKLIRTIRGFPDLKVPYFDFLRKGAQAIFDDFDSIKEAFLASPSYISWKAANPEKKPVQHPDFSEKLGNIVKEYKLMDFIGEKIAKTRIRDEIAEFLEPYERKQKLLDESDKLREELLYPIDVSLVFNELKKYLLLYISYEDGEESLSSKRFSGVMEPIELTMVDASKRAYEPIAFVVHIGSTLNSGHYITYVFIDGRGWYLFDDLKYLVENNSARRVEAATVNAELMNNKPTFILYRDAVIPIKSAATMSEDEIDATLAAFNNELGESTPELQAMMAAATAESEKPVTGLNAMLERIKQKKEATQSQPSQPKTPNEIKRLENLQARLKALKGGRRTKSGSKSKKRITRRLRR